MNWSTFIRKTHRVLSVAFTLSVIITFIALNMEKPIVWVSYVPLAPLALLFVSGTYLFLLPYAARWRRKS